MTWLDFFREEELKPYYKDLMNKVNELYETKEIYPQKEEIFNAFKYLELEKIKVVLLGQDPYPTKDVAMGLSFSVNDGCKVPKSLQNIFKEIKRELGIVNTSGNLIKWEKNGILLLNRILTVESGKPLSNQGIGWEIFTDNVIKFIEKLDQKIVYILLGNSAKTIKPLITNKNHLILETSHPSPLSVNRGFNTSNIFKDTIEYLGEKPNFWRNSDE